MTQRKVQRLFGQFVLASLVNNPWPSAGSGCAQVAGGTVEAGGAGACGLSALHTLKLIYEAHWQISAATDAWSGEIFGAITGFYLNVATPDAEFDRLRRG